MLGRIPPPLFKRLKDRTEEKIPGAVSKPSVKNLKQTDDSALLQCVVRGASPKPVVEWKESSGKVLPAEEHEETEREGKYDIVLQTTVTKSDNYTCEATQEKIHHQTSDWTHVFFSRAVSKPSVKIVKETDDSALLQCVVRGASPKPVVVWKDSSGNVLPPEEPEETEREGKYDIVLQTTVTKSDNYTCEATQEEIHHQTSDWTHVFFSKKLPSGEDSSGKMPVGVAVGLGGVGLVIGLVVGVFVYRWYDKRSRSRVYREAGSSDNRL